MNLEELKEVDLLTVENLKEHESNVLSLNEEELNEYILYALDTFYKTEEEGENPEKIETFFSNEKFKNIYRTLIDNDDAE